MNRRGFVSQACAAVGSFVGLICCRSEAKVEAASEDVTIPINIRIREFYFLTNEEIRAECNRPGGRRCAIMRGDELYHCQMDVRWVAESRDASGMYIREVFHESLPGVKWGERLPVVDRNLNRIDVWPK